MIIYSFFIAAPWSIIFDLATDCQSTEREKTSSTPETSNERAITTQPFISLAYCKSRAPKYTFTRTSLEQSHKQWSREIFFRHFSFVVDKKSGKYHLLHTQKSAIKEASLPGMAASNCLDYFYMA
jgi:hypothetical protein